jgi:hypothetical protein
VDISSSSLYIYRLRFPKRESIIKKREKKVFLPEWHFCKRFPRQSFQKIYSRYETEKGEKKNMAFSAFPVYLTTNCKVLIQGIWDRKSDVLLSSRKSIAAPFFQRLIKKDFPEKVFQRKVKAILKLNIHFKFR